MDCVTPELGSKESDTTNELPLSTPDRSLPFNQPTSSADTGQQDEPWYAKHFRCFLSQVVMQKYATIQYFGFEIPVRYRRLWWILS